MDCIYVGKEILAARKQKGLTQKQLAEKLGVTDKAVSKWERGLNYPDIELLETLAAALELDVPELLGLRESSSEQIVKEISEISREKKSRIQREIRGRAILNLVLGMVLGMTQMIASWEFHKLGMDGGIAGISTAGMLGVTGLIIGNAIYTIRKVGNM